MDSLWYADMLNKMRTHISYMAFYHDTKKDTAVAVADFTNHYENVCWFLYSS